MVTRSLCLLVLLALSASAQTPRIPQPESVNHNGLVGRWIVPGFQTETNAIDTSGAGNHGTIAAQLFQFLASRFGMTVNDASLQISKFNAGGARTYSFWVNPKSFSFMTVFSRRVERNEGAIYLRDPGYVQALVYNSGASQILSHSSPSTVVLNAWQHFAFTYGTDYIGKWYFNGTMVSQQAASQSAPWGYASTEPFLWLGSEGNTRYLNGAMSDFRIYNRALSADEIKRIYRGLQ
jgi:hypothetical protein